MTSHVLFDYPLHVTYRQHPIPLDGVPSIPKEVAKRWSQMGEDASITELERRLCDDAIEAACHVLFHRELNILGA